MRLADAVRLVDAARLRAGRIPVPAVDPRVVLAALVVVQWIAVLVFALTTQHNGWLYYQGGDQTRHYTGAWLLANGQLPPSYVGYGWSILLAPIAFFAGPSFLDALPAIVLLEVLVLLPIALLCVYGIAKAIAGRRFGYLAAILWIALPFAAIPLWVGRYHDRYVDQTVSQLVGLSGLSDFPSMVAVLLGGYLTVRALQHGDVLSAALAGLVIGYAIGIKPANGVVVVAPLLALAVARRWRSGLAFGVALLPSLVTLVLWKQRGLGQLPLFAFEETRVAAGAGAVGAISLDRYVPLDWDVLVQNYRELREFFWSAPLVVWLTLAGAVGVLRRSLPLGTLLVVWVGSFLIVKGTSPSATVEGGSFFRLLLPSYPAFLLLVAAAPLCLPVARLRRVCGAASGRLPRPRAVAAAAAVALVAVPLAFVVAPRALDGPDAVVDPAAAVYVPVVEDLSPRVRAAGREIRLEWPAFGGGSVEPVYRILRAQGDFAICSAARASAAYDCWLTTETVGATRDTTFQYREPPGQWSYLVGVAADYENEALEGDILVLSAPVRATR